MITINLEGSDYIQLCDLLKAANLCQTGGHAKLVISEGEVKVDGKTEFRKRCKIKSGQIVEYNQEKIQVR